MKIEPQEDPHPPPSHIATAVGCLALLIWSMTALVSFQLRSIPLCQLVTSIFAAGFATTLLRITIAPRTGDRTPHPWHAWVVGISVLLGTQYGYMAAFKFAPPEQVDLIYYLWPILVVIGVSFLPHDKFCWKHFAGTLIGFAGIALLVLRDDDYYICPETCWRGYSLALISALCWAGYTLYARKQRHASTTLLGLCCGPAALVSWIFHQCFWEHTVEPSTMQIGLILFMGVAVLGISLSLWDHAVKRGHFKLLSTLAYFNPVVSIAILVAAGLTEATPTLATATLMVVAGSALPKVRRR